MTYQSGDNIPPERPVVRRTGGGWGWWWVFFAIVILCIIWWGAWGGWGGGPRANAPNNLQHTNGAVPAANRTAPAPTTEPAPIR